MPNPARYILCPYYKKDLNKNISCEDITRRLRTMKSKKEWMDAYCSSSWEACPHSRALTEMYAKGEEMSDVGKKILEQDHKIRELQKELHKATTMLGKKEKALEECKKRHEQASYTVRKLEARNAELGRKVAMSELKEKKTYDEIVAFSLMFEKRLAYLMETYSGGILSEKAVDEFCEGKLISIKPSDYEDGCVTEWKVIIEKEKEDGTERSAAEVSEAGAGEDEQKGEGTILQCEAHPGNDR